VTSQTQSYTTTVVTVTGGSTFSSVITTDKVVASTTGYATATVSPSVQNGSGSGDGSSGLSSSSKKIIGGVVGGIGGAILVGAIAVVAWRLWGRKHHKVATEDDDIFVGTNDSVMREKAAGNASTPFRSNLEQYHNPNGAVNTASNF
jgi:hypothetical protein